LLIDDFEETVYHLPAHSHTYYEMIYIFKGNGTHVLNSNRIPYNTGDLFVLSPDDEHYFEIAESTRFIFIKFTDSYFSGKSYYYLTTAPEKIMRLMLLKEMKLSFDEPSRLILRNSIENIITYHQHVKDMDTSPLVYFQILSIFGLIREAMVKLNVRIDHGQPDKEQLISYIHQHIYDPAAIQIKSIADYFNIAPNYFSAYFKRNFEVTYREYIDDYRMKLIENRITSGKSSMKEIAEEFGFADGSHFTRFFKTKHGMSPRSFAGNRRD